MNGAVRTSIALLALTASATPGVADELRFISCPVYRDADAGRKSGCWLTNGSDGQRYDVSLAPTKPDWNHEILVEGIVGAKQDGACGGVVLDPVRVSVLPGACTRHMLPAEGFPGRRFVLPVRNIRPMSEARAVPARPWTDRTFTLTFDFDRSFPVYQLDDYYLDEAITYIRAVKPERIVITGHAATEPAMVSGRAMVEAPERARERAQLAAESLRRLGVDMNRVSVDWRVASAPIGAPAADGLLEPSRRRVDIEVIVLASPLPQGSLKKAPDIP